MSTRSAHRADPPLRRPERPAQILEAACRAIVARGFPATRIADIAREAGTSTGTVHYYFDVKDDVLLAALKHASARLFDRLDAVMAAERGAVARLAHLIGVACPFPGPRRDEYVLWIELWTQVVRRPELLAEVEPVSRRWRAFFHEAIAAGVAAGELRPVAPAGEVAERLIAMVHGLGFEAAVGYGWTSPERMRDRLLDFAAEQLRLAPAELRRQLPPTGELAA